MTEQEYISISASEYRELLNAKRDAECLIGAIKSKHDGYSAMSFEEIKLLCAMYGGEAE